jgi:hypothetical protein
MVGIGLNLIYNTKNVHITYCWSILGLIPRTGLGAGMIAD